MYPTFVLLVPPLLNFNPLFSTNSHFRVTAKGFQMTLTTARSYITAYTMYVLLCDSKFTLQSHSATSFFQVAGHFDTSALNDPKMILTITRSKYPIHVFLHVLSVPVSQISLHLAL